MERVKGIEPSCAAWEALQRPLFLKALGEGAFMISVLAFRRGSVAFPGIPKPWPNLTQAGGR
jgi:hypothetical protein